MSPFSAKRLLVARRGAAAPLPRRRRPTSPAPARPSPIPIYSKWADAYKQQTGIGLNYQSIGSGGGIKQIKAKTVTFGASDMPLKPEELQGSRAGAVPDDHRRGGAGGEHQGRGGRSAGARWRHASPRSTWAKSPSGTIRASRSSIRSWRCRPRRSRRCTARTAPAPTSCSRTTCPRRARSSRTSIGAHTSVQWPVGIGAKGNEGVANMTRADRRRHRLRRVRLRQAEQDGLCGPASTQAARPSPRVRTASRRPPPMPTGRTRRRLLPDPDQPARCQELADHRRELHPAVRDTAGCGGHRRGAEVLRLGLQERWQDGGGPGLRAAARRPWSSRCGRPGSRRSRA